MPHVTSNKIQLAYEERGHGDPLLLIMGLGGDRSLWLPHVEVYEQHFRCILFDNRGAGESDGPPGPYRTRIMADDAVGLLNALGIERAHVAGISMGGAIAQELALNHPDRVHRLVLVSTWARCDTFTASALESLCRIRAAVAPDVFIQMIQLWLFAPPYYEAHLEELREAGRIAETCYMPQPAYAAQTEACLAHDTLDRLDRIQAPTLITAGGADFFTPPAFARDLHRRIPGSRLIVYPDTSHAHHYEVVDGFNTTTTAFLRGS